MCAKLEGAKSLDCGLGAVGASHPLPAVAQKPSVIIPALKRVRDGGKRQGLAKASGSASRALSGALRTIFALVAVLIRVLVPEQPVSP